MDHGLVACSQAGVGIGAVEGTFGVEDCVDAPDSFQSKQ